MNKFYPSREADKSILNNNIINIINNYSDYSIDNIKSKINKHLYKFDLLPKPGINLLDIIILCLRYGYNGFYIDIKYKYTPLCRYLMRNTGSNVICKPNDEYLDFYIDININTHLVNIFLLDKVQNVFIVNNYKWI